MKKFMKASESTDVSIAFDPNSDQSNQRIVVGFATLDLSLIHI